MRVGPGIVVLALSTGIFALCQRARIRRGAERFVVNQVDRCLADRDRDERVLRAYVSKARIDDGRVSEASITSGLTEETTERPSNARPIAAILQPLLKRSVVRHTLTKAFHDFAAAVELRRGGVIVLKILRASIWDHGSLASLAMEMGPQAARDLAALLVLHARAAEGDAEADAEVSALRNPSSPEIGAGS